MTGGARELVRCQTMSAQAAQAPTNAVVLAVALPRPDPRRYPRHRKGTDSSHPKTPVIGAAEPSRHVCFCSDHRRPRAPGWELPTGAKRPLASALPSPPPPRCRSPAEPRARVEQWEKRGDQGGARACRRTCWSCETLSRPCRSRARSHSLGSRATANLADLREGDRPRSQAGYATPVVRASTGGWLTPRIELQLPVP